MNVDRAERHLLHEVDAHHHHPGNPEEDDVEAGHQNIGRVVLLEFGRLVGPAQRRERPQGGGEPGIQDVLVPGEFGRLAVMCFGGGQRLLFGQFDEYFAVGPVPRGNLMPPPQLAGNAPGLNVFEP